MAWMHHDNALENRRLKEDIRQRTLKSHYSQIGHRKSGKTLSPPQDNAAAVTARPNSAMKTLKLLTG